VRPTLLYTHSGAVIPAKAGIQLNKTGFRVKPGMTIKVKGLSTHYTSVVSLTLLYIDFDAVIPAKAGIHHRKTGFRVKPGMTGA